MGKSYTYFDTLPEYDNHHMVIHRNDPISGLNAFIAIHRLTKNPSFGATRMQIYPTKVDALRDALRLSKLMSYKSALAGLPFGGAKGVIFANPYLKKRTNLFRAYANTLNSLNGKFITGVDMGLLNTDVVHMKKITPFVVGTQVDPAYYTALGIRYGMKIAAKHRYGNEDLAGKKVAIQGLGKVGFALAQQLVKEGAKLYVADINQANVRSAKKLSSDITVVKPNTIHKIDTNFFSPCTSFGIVNKKTINSIRADIIVGAANNQLMDEEIGDTLFKKGILYAPDYVVNAGGILSVSDEYTNKEQNTERITKAVMRIKLTLGSIFKQSLEKNESPHRIANRMAEKIISS
jgi:glutamate dehydrogenase/leucine dehydrogenase